MKLRGKTSDGKDTSIKCVVKRRNKAGRKEGRNERQDYEEN